MRILLSGGGTGGSVSPLLAVAKEIKKRDPKVKFLFVGTRKGLPEKKMIQDTGFFYRNIYCGKLRRYFDWRNFFDPILIFLGIIQSIFIIKKFKPDIIFSAGSFVSVPVAWAGWLLGVPNLIHQQDVIPGLANKIMAQFATKITVTFEKSLKDFPKKKTVWTGNPVRPEILESNKEKAIEYFKLEKNLPTLLVIGGGTGAQKINELIWQIVPELTKFCQIIHLFGRDKFQVSSLKFQVSKRYHSYEFLTDKMADAFAAADLVISRAGMGVLTELSALGKPTILIPLPDSHQEKNACYFEKNEAAVVLWQKFLIPEVLLEKIKTLLIDKEKLSDLSKNILKLSKSNAAQNIANQIFEIVGQN